MLLRTGTAGGTAAAAATPPGAVLPGSEGVAAVGTAAAVAAAAATTTPGGAGADPKMVEALRFYNSHTAQIEVVRYDRTLEQVLNEIWIDWEIL